MASPPPNSESSPIDANRPPQRCPAAAAAIAFAAGIGGDVCFGFDFTIWATASFAFASLSIAGLALDRHRLGAAALLLCALCLGASRHHWFLSTAAVDDISHFAESDAAVPVRLTGRVAAAPVLVPAREEEIPTAWQEKPDRTFCRVDCDSLETNSGSVDVSGTIRLQVSGQLTGIGVGDTVEIRGWMRRPGGPKNPGEFDFARYLREQGIRAVVYVEDPAAVAVLARGGWSIKREAAIWRRRCERILKEHLADDTLPVGSAMLLGDRSRLAEETKSAFVQSGMIHILAISGLHVGVLALFTWWVCRAINLTPRASTTILLLVLSGYLLITDLRPSVVRATVMITVMVLGRPWYRRTGIWNSLSLAVLVVLAWRPADLFNAGAQLSFLSVTAIVTSESWWRRWEAGRSPLSQLQERGPLASAAHRLGRWTLRSALLMTVIWLFTAPLVAARFNVVSPVGMAINIVLMPVVGIVLSAGYLLLLLGLVMPPIAFVPAAVFNNGLSGLLALVGWASSLRLGHVDVSGPADSWLAGYYFLLAAAVLIAPKLRGERWAWCAVCGWTILGLAGARTPEPPRALRCTFLSTGHGVAVLVEMPNGKTLLYDAGCLSGGTRATRAVRGALWHRGRTRLDAVVVSHADVDHFNGVPGLLKTIPIGRVLIAQSFLDFEQESVSTLCATAKAERAPIEILLAGDQLVLDRRVAIRVLHPGRRRHDSDNANSIVLEIEYAGRRILLTGDIEKGGLDELLDLPPRKTDALLSPHHGSPSANPVRLAKWARPGFVVASGGKRVKLDVLRKLYGAPTQVLSTHSGGAVTFEIHPDGTMTMHRGAQD